MITTNHFAINCTTEGTIILRWLVSLQPAIPANDERFSRVSTSVADIYLIIVNLIIINCLQAIITLIVILCTPPPLLHSYTTIHRRTEATPPLHTGTGTEGSYRHRHRGFILPPAQRAHTATGTEGFYRHRHWGLVPAPAFEGIQTAYPNFYRHRQIPVPAYYYRFYVILWLVVY